MRRTVGLLTLAGMVAGCGFVSVSTPGPLDGPVNLEPALPTVPAAVSAACIGIGLHATLHGDPRDPRVAWLAMDDGSRREVVWPAGYHARFATVGDVVALEVLDASGRLVIGEADVVDGVCVTSDPNTVLLMPPFE